MKLLSNKIDNATIHLFEENRPALFAMVIRVAKSPHQTDDILQNVFIKVWEHREQLRQLQHPEAWLYRVAKNELIDFLRKTAADKRLQSRLWHNLQTEVNHVEEVCRGRECETLIKKVVNDLPAQRQLVYRLNREAGLNYREIADKLSISTHTVKNQISLALRSISQFVSGTLGFLLINFFF